jgi:hypothetical protein
MNQTLEILNQRIANSRDMMITNDTILTVISLVGFEVCVFHYSAISSAILI